MTILSFRFFKRCLQLIPSGFDNRIQVVYDVADRHKRSLESEELKRVPGALKILLQLGKTQLRINFHRLIMSSDNNTAEGLKIFSRTQVRPKIRASGLNECVDPHSFQQKTKKLNQYLRSLGSIPLKESEMSEDNSWWVRFRRLVEQAQVLGLEG